MRAEKSKVSRVHVPIKKVLARGCVNYQLPFHATLPWISSLQFEREVHRQEREREDRDRQLQAERRERDRQEQLREQRERQEQQLRYSCRRCQTLYWDIYILKIKVLNSYEELVVS